MGLFGGKDWNIIAVIYERKDLYRVNGNRSKGGDAVKARDGAKGHSRTIFWAVFDQKRNFLEGEQGKGFNLIADQALQKLKKELPTNQTVNYILGLLERAELPMAAKPLVWTGYPREEEPVAE